MEKLRGSLAESGLKLVVHIFQYLPRKGAVLTCGFPQIAALRVTAGFLKLSQSYLINLLQTPVYSSKATSVVHSVSCISNTEQFMDSRWEISQWQRGKYFLCVEFANMLEPTDKSYLQTPLHRPSFSFPLRLGSLFGIRWCWPYSLKSSPVVCSRPRGSLGMCQHSRIRISGNRP